MDRLIYSSLAAMRGAMGRQATIANNLANVNTSGFRGEIANAQSLWIRGQELNGRATVSDEVKGADMSKGTAAQTGRDLDVSLNGDAMLTVQAADGSEAYTRRGDLQQTNSGLLTTGDGSIVMGENGPITLPAADTVSITADGTIYIVPQGGDPQAPQQVDKLKLVSPGGSTIAKGLDGLFRNTAGGTLPSDPDARVSSRSLEGSNVSASSALVDMIDTSRAWDSQIKMLTTAQELDKSSADLMQLPQ
ncbi:flagellar basal body rod protein FlgF [Sphingomonas nostoxanthinifaciens]|uniref:flagellar basal body rod protein FlgF n=1 Tax=Sphingomonas nostoxanthinifaciens TaxID=2872652 RepID=UPI001CC1D8D8|nr:flagellar basal body rod protein FlgF [Sphingomonas nostoxanthinifaciens]UAK26059.1 flagellar basal body rod protein FlgF [Sphingomonas nostoxanthinifaciens]